MTDDLAMIRNHLIARDVKRDIDRAAKQLARADSEDQLASIFFLDALELAAFYINHGFLDGDMAAFIGDYLCTDLAACRDMDGLAAKIHGDDVEYCELRRFASERGILS
jgi:hypothetical protein